MSKMDENLANPEDKNLYERLEPGELEDKNNGMSSAAVAERITDYVEHCDMQGLEALYNFITPDAQIAFNPETNNFDELHEDENGHS